MNPIRRNIICAAAAGLLAAGAASLAQEGRRDEDSGRRSSSDRELRSRSEADPFSERYALLLENNIFLRDRRPTVAPTTRATAPPPPPPPIEKSWMLVGVVYEEGAFRAYFENLRTNEVTRVAVGETIAEGAISELFIDSIAYARNGDQRWIEIGQDLTGVFPEIAAPQRPVTASRTTGASGGSAGTPANTMSIEERLRQRRLQEAGGAAPGAIQAIPGAQGDVRIQGVQGDVRIRTIDGSTGQVFEFTPARVPPPPERGRGSDDPPDEPPPDDPPPDDPD